MTVTVKSPWLALGMLASMFFLLPLTAARATDVVASPAATTKWRMIPAATFLPRSSNMPYKYESFGCVSAPTGTDLVHRLILPNGATLRYLRLYYKDTRAGDIQAAVTRYDASGGLEDLGGLLYSEDVSGFSSTLSTDLTHTVDGIGHGYVVNAQFRQPGGDVIFASGFEAGESGSTSPATFCAVRVMWEES